MAKYYVNKNAQPRTGDNEVHVEGCSWLAIVNSEHREYLGEFYTCKNAVIEARVRGYNADGCKYCSPICHKS